MPVKLIEKNFMRGKKCGQASGRCLRFIWVYLRHKAQWLQARRRSESVLLDVLFS